MHLERLTLSDQAQRAAAQPAVADAPQVVAVLPVVPGDTIPLPFDPQGLLARLDVNGNLASDRARAPTSCRTISPRICART